MKIYIQNKINIKKSHLLTYVQKENDVKKNKYKDNF